MRALTYPIYFKSLSCQIKTKYNTINGKLYPIREMKIQKHKNLRLTKKVTYKNFYYSYTNHYHQLNKNQWDFHQK